MLKVRVRMFRNVLALALAGLVVAGPGVAHGQDGASTQRSKVLVPPLPAASTVDEDFGKKLAEELRKRLSQFDVLTAVEKDEYKKALKKYDLKEETMTPIKWRQLASQIGAGLVFTGEATSGQGGYALKVNFVDVQSGDELSIPELTARGNKNQAARNGADQIAEALKEQVQFLRSRAFCADYMRAEQYADALRNCNQALEVNPENSRAHFLRGNIYREQGEWEKAREDYRVVVEQQPSNTDALQSLAYVNAQLENMDRATELYREYLTFNPNDEDVRLSVAYNLANSGATGEAMQIVQDGLARDSSATALWEYLGTLALKKGTEGQQAQTGASASVTDTAAIQTAVESFSRVLEARGDSVQPQLLTNTVAAHRLIGDLQGALEFSDRALERFPDNAQLWSLRADALADMERYEQAVASVDSVLARDEDYRNAHQKRAMFNLRAGNQEAAVEDFRAAVERGADGDQVANRLFGVAYNDHFKQGRLSRAIDLFQVALEFAGSESVENQIQFFTSWGYFQRGMAVDESNTEEACQPARRALNLFQGAQQHLQQAGSYQQEKQAQIKKSLDGYIFREQQIIKKACG